MLPLIKGLPSAGPSSGKTETAVERNLLSRDTLQTRCNRPDSALALPRWLIAWYRADTGGRLHPALSSSTLLRALETDHSPLSPGAYPCMKCCSVSIGALNYGSWLAPGSRSLVTELLAAGTVAPGCI